MLVILGDNSKLNVPCFFFFFSYLQFSSQNSEEILWSRVTVLSLFLLGSSVISTVPHLWGWGKDLGGRLGAHQSMAVMSGTQSCVMKSKCSCQLHCRIRNLKNYLHIKSLLSFLVLYPDWKWSALPLMRFIILWKIGLKPTLPIFLFWWMPSTWSMCLESFAFAFSVRNLCSLTILAVSLMSTLLAAG